MAVTLETTISRFRGLSTDDKPVAGVLEAGAEETLIRVGSIFTERDTGDKYTWTGSVWERQAQTIEELFANLMQVNLDILGALRVIQSATVTLANNAWETDYPTGR